MDLCMRRLCTIHHLSQEKYRFPWLSEHALNTIGRVSRIANILLDMPSCCGFLKHLGSDLVLKFCKCSVCSTLIKTCRHSQKNQFHKTKLLCSNYGWYGLPLFMLLIHDIVLYAKRISWFRYGWILCVRVCVYEMAEWIATMNLIHSLYL